jgi:hypothetical protein
MIGRTVFYYKNVENPRQKDRQWLQHARRANLPRPISWREYDVFRISKVNNLIPPKKWRPCRRTRRCYP